ncbi:polysaccharide biosynthesis/export family protein [Bordetella petrii]|uniref:polysaccharide biosynthesis/export family protein n=1 Tax=Bordetella petrii TaxID=94624 RepID=UPI001E2CB4AF|nr:polysaccharide biosynthesis/export family protein [Bordetella petrii]MCD0501729.1 polysaccharide biosynthesis/export family protein [Bordetella petrii]
MIDYRPIAKANMGMSRLLSRIAIGALVLTLSGCGILSGAGPYRNSITWTDDSTDPRYDLINLTAATISPYIRPPAPHLTSDVSQLPVSNVRLIPGDVIGLLISDSSPEGGLFAPLSIGGTSFPKVSVDASGNISLPYVGKLKVSGMTLPQVQTAVQNRLKGKATDPQVYAQLVGDLSGSVLVAGSVKAPGRFSALQGPLTLLDAINMAGGPLLDPHLTKVTVRTGSEVHAYSYQELLEGRNQPVPPRSEIILERARQRFVAMGAVNTPGLHDLPSANPSLLETLGVVGGLDESKADPTGVFVFRLTNEDTDQPHAQVFSLNMRNPESIFLARQFLVQPEDAIYVTNAAVYEWQKIITPIVQAVLIGQRF